MWFLGKKIVNKEYLYYTIDNTNKNGNTWKYVNILSSFLMLHSGGVKTISLSMNKIMYRED